METAKQKVYSFVRFKTELILNTLSESASRALLANLRRGIGRPPGDLPELWGTLFDGFPDSFMSYRGDPTRAEWAVYIAMTCFALHQQGHDCRNEPMSKADSSFGIAVRRLVPAGDEDALERVRKRFNKVATATDMIELSYQLRGIVQLLRGEGIPLDYPALASELFLFQFSEYAPSVRLRWGQDFYRTVKESISADDGRKE